MKVLAFNSSPRMEGGNTALILNPLLGGMREAGAEVELIYTLKLKINPCLGEFNCWLKTPGRCFQKDDMQELIPKINDADVLVLATPVYVDGMTGPLKTLLDRMIPLLQPLFELKDGHRHHPLFELRDGHCRHPRRWGCGGCKVVLVANCGFWEMDNFDPLVTHVKAFCKNAGSEFAGALLRPHGGGLRAMLEADLPMQDVFDAARDAGRQLIREGRMSDETLAVVSRDLIPLEVYVQVANQKFQEALSQLEEK